jgi:hypothetical protein
MATKAETIYREAQELMASGVARPDAFAQLAEKYSQPVTSIRGAFYGAKRQIEGGGASRPRKRETTPADAVEQATITLRRAVEAIDREVEAAKERASEAAAEAKALAASAAERKTEIEKKIAVLES